MEERDGDEDDIERIRVVTYQELFVNAQDRTSINELEPEPRQTDVDLS